MITSLADRPGIRRTGEHLACSLSAGCALVLATTTVLFVTHPRVFITRAMLESPARSTWPYHLPSSYFSNDSALWRSTPTPERSFHFESIGVHMVYAEARGKDRTGASTPVRGACSTTYGFPFPVLRLEWLDDTNVLPTIPRWPDMRQSQGRPLPQDPWMAGEDLLGNMALVVDGRIGSIVASFVAANALLSAVLYGIVVYIALLLRGGSVVRRAMGTASAAAAHAAPIAWLSALSVSLSALLGARDVQAVLTAVFLALLLIPPCALVAGSMLPRPSSVSRTAAACGAGAVAFLAFGTAWPVLPGALGAYVVLCAGVAIARWRPRGNADGALIG